MTGFHASVGANGEPQRNSNLPDRQRADGFQVYGTWIEAADESRERDQASAAFRPRFRHLRREFGRNFN
jgi:hypothetical protein